VIGKRVEQDPLFISHPVIKTENEVSFLYMCIFVVTKASRTFTHTCCLWRIHVKHLSGQMDMKETNWVCLPFSVMTCMFCCGQIY
jgi:hypothetical protein